MSPFSTTAPLLAAYGLTYSWTEVAGARTLD